MSQKNWKKPLKRKKTRKNNKYLYLAEVRIKNNNPFSQRIIGVFDLEMMRNYMIPKLDEINKAEKNMFDVLSKQLDPDDINRQYPMQYTEDDINKKDVPDLVHILNIIPNHNVILHKIRNKKLHILDKMNEIYTDNLNEHIKYNIYDEYYDLGYYTEKELRCFVLERFEQYVENAEGCKLYSEKEIKTTNIENIIGIIRDHLYFNVCEV